MILCYYIIVMKKLLYAALSVVILAALAVCIYYLIPKNDERELAVYAKDISVTVGESKLVEYSVTITSAAISYNMEENAFAHLEFSGGAAYVHGDSAGEINMKIFAKSGAKNFVKTIKVTVVSNGENKGDDNPPDNTEDDNPKPTPEPEYITFTNLVNCTADGNIIRMEASTCVLDFSTDASSYDVSFDYDTTKLQIELDTNVGYGAYRVTTLQEGEHDLSITLKTKTYAYKIVTANA